MNYPSPQITVKGLRALFPTARFNHEIVLTIENKQVVGVVAPSEVTPEQITAAALAATPAQPVRTLSKLTLTRRLRDLGKEDAFWAILTAQPVLYREFILAQELRTNDPMFTAQAPQLKAALALTDEQFTELIQP
jgi:hypothetical protein